MTKESEEQLTDKELEKIFRKAFRGIRKVREEPHPIFISDGEGNSDSTIREITAWLFHRRQDNGG